MFFCVALHESSKGSAKSFFTFFFCLKIVVASTEVYKQEGKSYFESIILVRPMLTSALNKLVNNLVKVSFLGKKKKKAINVLTDFFIFHKSNVKTFLK